MPLNIGEVAVASFASSAEIAALHAPCRSHFNGRAIEIITAVQIGIFKLPRTRPLWRPEEFHAIVPQEQIVQNAARPHDIVYLRAILVPIFSILKTIR
jgi:hypothetical protein